MSSSSSHPSRFTSFLIHDIDQIGTKTYTGMTSIFTQLASIQENTYENNETSTTTTSDITTMSSLLQQLMFVSMTSGLITSTSSSTTTTTNIQRSPSRLLHHLVENDIDRIYNIHPHLANSPSKHIAAATRRLHNISLTCIDEQEQEQEQQRKNSIIYATTTPYLTCQQERITPATSPLITTSSADVSPTISPLSSPSSSPYIRGHRGSLVMV